VIATAIVFEAIFLVVIAGYLIVVALIRGRRWKGQAPATVLGRYDGRFVTIGLGTQLVTERTGRLTIDPSDSSLSLLTEHKKWPIRLGDVQWFVDPDTGAKTWLTPPRRHHR
jgi:hypothetical protein